MPLKKSNRKVSRKSRKVSRKSRKVSRKSRKVSRKSRKVSRKSRKVSRKSRKVSRKVSRKSRKSRKVSRKSRKASRKSRKASDNKINFILKIYITEIKDDENIYRRVKNVSKIPSNVRGVFDKYFKEEMGKDINIDNDNIVKINKISYGNDDFIKIYASSMYPLDYVDKSKGIVYSLRSSIEVYNDKSIWQILNHVKGNNGFKYNFEKVIIN